MKNIFKAAILSAAMIGVANAATENGSITMTVVAPVTMTALGDAVFGNVPINTTPTALTTSSDINATNGIAITVTPSAVVCLDGAVTGTVAAQAGNPTAGAAAAETHTFDVALVVAAATEGATSCSYSITADYS